MDIDRAKILSGEDVLKQLGTSETGLSDEEATRRLVQFGPNTLQKHSGSGQF